MSKSGFTISARANGEWITTSAKPRLATFTEAWAEVIASFATHGNRITSCHLDPIFELGQFIVITENGDIEEYAIHPVHMTL